MHHADQLTTSSQYGPRDVRRRGRGEHVGDRAHGIEAEVPGLIAAGATNPDIAALLVVSQHTVKSHVNRIFAKTGSTNRAAAARYARDHGLS